MGQALGDIYAACVGSQTGQPTPAAAREWSARVPRRFLTTLAPLLLAGATIASIATETTGPADTLATVDAIGTLAQGVTIAAIAFLVVRPHATIGWAAAGAVVVAVTPVGADARTTWLVVALVLTLLALADELGAVRQRILARSWGSPVTPDCGPAVRADLLRRRLVPLAGALLGVLVALGSVGWWVHDAQSTEQFRSTALETTGTVVEVADDDLSALVRTEDGGVVKVGLPTLYPKVGDQVDLLLSPNGKRGELVGDPFDPTGTLVLAGGGLLAAVVLARSEVARRRGAERLLRDGTAPATFIAVPTGGPWLSLEAVGDRGRTTSRVRIGWGIAAEQGNEHAAAWAQGSVDDQVWDSDDDEDEDEDYYAEWSRLEQERMESMPDEELLALGAAHRADREASAAQRALAEAPLDAPQMVVVHGLTAQGDFPLIATADGRWLVPSRAARDTSLRWLARPQRLLRIHAATEYRPTEPTGGIETARRSRWTILVASTGKTLPVVLTPAVGWLAWWVTDVGSVAYLLKLAPLLFLGYAWVTTAQDRLSLSEAGVRTRHMVLAPLVRWDRLTAVVADENSLALRVRNPADAVIVHQHRDLGRFLPGAATPIDAARRIEAERPSPTSAGSRTGVTYLPTPAVMLTALWAVATIVGVSVA